MSFTAPSTRSRFFSVYPPRDKPECRQLLEKAACLRHYRRLPLSRAESSDVTFSTEAAVYPDSAQLWNRVALNARKILPVTLRAVTNWDSLCIAMLPIHMPHRARSQPITTLNTLRSHPSSATGFLEMHMVPSPRNECKRQGHFHAC